MEVPVFPEVDVNVNLPGSDIYINFLRPGASIQEQTTTNSRSTWTRIKEWLAARELTLELHLRHEQLGYLPCLHFPVCLPTYLDSHDSPPDYC
jgi:hypothetical protein